MGSSRCVRIGGATVLVAVALIFSQAKPWITPLLSWVGVVSSKQPLSVPGLREAFAAPAATAHAPGNMTAAAASGTVNAAPSGFVGEAGFYAAQADLNPSERAGREIWYKATAGNSRFHTYVFQQRIGVLIDWYRVLNAKERDDRFAAWGIINDPSCCTPGTEACPAKTLEETFGFDFCPGDDALLGFVGRPGYRDPACDFQDAPVDASDSHAKAGDQRQSTCDLAFGTSTGALGFRKFPNPRFDRTRWLAVNGSLSNWEGFNRRLASDPASSDSRVSHLADGSLEPPYLIGMSCGACHIAFDPLKPPRDPAHPEWANLKAAVGNQYSRISEVLASGMPHASLEYQVFAHARPGTTDTSAVPTDQINNPGTMNAIINTSQRPTFEGEVVKTWQKVSSCAPAESEATCWCEPGRSEKCWQLGTRTQTVHHILKGGEDSVGALLAIQRVYFNIGSCAEQCWINHLTDLRQLDPQGRAFGQSPFDIGQCRRDCPNFRAVEDRLQSILDFFLSKENDATDLQAARQNTRRAQDPSATYGYDDLVSELEKQFGQGSVERGRLVFAEGCARCHSSVPETKGGPFKNRDFRAIDPVTGQRLDWLGNDQSTLVSEVGTFRCRALHSNHASGHVWEQYGSESLRALPPDPNLTDPQGGGRGYYRNPSLLSLWAHAPFLHNNAIGPELCGKPKNRDNFFYRSPYVDRISRQPLADAPGCLEYDPSVEGRFRLFVSSMRELLTPEELRPAKLTRFDVDVPLPFGLRVADGETEKQLFGFTMVIPKGTASAALGNYQHKAFFDDLVLARTDPRALEAKFVQQLGKEEGKDLADQLHQVAKAMLADPAQLIETIHKYPKIVQAYRSCSADLESLGHRFGTDLPDERKQALIAFLATL